MKRSTSFFIAKEAFWPIFFIAIIVSLTLLTSESFFNKLIALLFFLITLYLFRNPERLVDYYDAASIKAPCDGYISSIETIACKGIIQDECLKITVQNRLLDASQLRSPIEGTVEVVNHYRGAQLSLHSSKAAFLNEQAKIVFREEKSPDHVVVIKHQLDRFNLALSLYPEGIESIKVGRRYGFIFHGQTTIFIPSSCRLAVKNGDEITASTTLLGYFS